VFWLRRCKQRQWRWLGLSEVPNWTMPLGCIGSEDSTDCVARATVRQSSNPDGGRSRLWTSCCYNRSVGGSTEWSNQPKGPGSRNSHKIRIEA
jgi:hypothetical protein